MISCPNCGGLNPDGSSICGACGATLPNNDNASVNQNVIVDSLSLYETDSVNNKVSDIKNKHSVISFGHIMLFIFSICSWFLIPYRWLKLLLSFLFFYLAESSNNKNSILLVLTRIITAVQIWGVVIALILKIFTSASIVAKYFEYFRF